MVTGILGSIFLGTSEIGQAVAQSSAVYLQSFSREHEFEADTLGVRYLARAGYTTDAMASFLASLQAYSSLEAQVSGQPDPASRYNIMSTHPRTQDRVVAATRAANVQQVPDSTIGNREYMAAIDGIIFGGSPRPASSGTVFSSTSPLDFLFEVPSASALSTEPSRLSRVVRTTRLLFSMAGSCRRHKHVGLSHTCSGEERPPEQS